MLQKYGNRDINNVLYRGCARKYWVVRAPCLLPTDILEDGNLISILVLFSLAYFTSAGIWLVYWNYYWISMLFHFNYRICSTFVPSLVSCKSFYCITYLTITLTPGRELTIQNRNILRIIKNCFLIPSELLTYNLPSVIKFFDETSKLLTTAAATTPQTSWRYYMASLISVLIKSSSIPNYHQYTPE